MSNEKGAQTPHDRKDGQDAVCFTAGPKGVAFSAGMIHAWLAADRESPKVAAGISAGALSAAAFERCYRELSMDPGTHPGIKEARRWNWFRRYLNEITYEPLDVIWSAIPDPVDFFADKPPVADPSVPQALAAEEMKARQNYYRLVKLGLWLAGLRVSVRDVANLVVSFVRFKERYAHWVWQGARVLAGSLVICLKMVIHFACSPLFIVERNSPAGPQFPRPLFGWPVWLIAAALLTDGTYCVLKIAFWLTPYLQFLTKEGGWLAPLFESVGGYLPILTTILALLERIARYDRWWLWIVVLVIASFIPLLAMSLYFRKGGPVRYLFNQLGIARGILHQYTLHRKLFELFREDPLDDHGPVVGSPEPRAKYPGSMHLLIVATPLKQVPHLKGQQVWAAPGTPVVEALLAAFAVPGLFPPVTCQTPEDVQRWISRDRVQTLPARLDLIDAAAVRQNPLPAFFAWLKCHPSVAPALTGDGVQDAGIHLCYAVPTDPVCRPAGDPPAERVDIVTAAFSSMDLARRRDTRMEARQTNFISELELWTRRASSASAATPRNGVAGNESCHSTRGPLFPIFVDEIAPVEEIATDSLAPERTQLLKTSAEGCRRTLEVLYRNRIGNFGRSADKIPCAALLRQIAPQRAAFIKEDAPGVPEICSQCTKELVSRPVTLAPPKEVRPLPGFEPLFGHKPRIVFLASGGVFRGAFHIGVIGAMQAAGIRPDLIVGASVGSLMGGALGAISKLGPPESEKLLGKLALTFLHVDRDIALTRPLKNAAKQLGVRSRCVDLSPAELRRAVRRGAKADPGYAVTGAPPALLDAISTLFLIPHDATREIASKFVAGRITDAMSLFWQQVRCETLQRLDIETALIGTSLLETAARELLGQRLGIPMDTAQPYHNAHNPERSISFFGVTSDLHARQGLVLDRDVNADRSYDFVMAGLSSSAFPAVFAPRQQAEVLPGHGGTNVLYSDGGMFDNLPFFPAIEILSAVQSKYREGSAETAFQSLRRRSAQPDLFIAAALESDQEQPGDAEDLREIIRRARTLKVNVKLSSFEDTSEVVADKTSHLLEAWDGKHLPAGLPAFMDQMVPAGVLKIAPADQEHLNGTFAFCSAVGFNQDRVATSIADGCFQTLQSLESHRAGSTLAAVAVQTLMDPDNPRIKVIATTIKKPDGTHCPFFLVNQEALVCPFATAAERYSKTDAKELRLIYSSCAGDSKHKRP